MHILCSGSNGFIGQHLFNSLKPNHKIIGFDRNKNKNLLNLGDLAETFLEFKPDIVIHLASNVSNDINECRDDVIALLNLLAFCKEFEVKKFIFTSSAAVYGNSYPKTIPINPYGIAKLQCEQWCDYYSEIGLNVIILRLSNVYGLNGKGVINQFMQRIKDGLPLTINGNGYQIRDFIHIDDVKQVIEQCINSDISNDILNVSTNKGSTIWDILKILYEITNQDIRISFKPELTKEVKISKLDNSDLIMSEFLFKNSFRSFFSLKQGIEELCKEM